MEKTLLRSVPMYDPPHPGEFITATYLEPFGISARKLATALGVASTTVTRILSGDARVTPEMAIRLEAVLHGSATFWLRMQEAYDLAVARRNTDASTFRPEVIRELIPA